jgi:putative ABC transport system permease protein
VKDFHFADLHDSIEAMGFLVNSAPVYQYMIARLNKAGIGAAIAGIRQTWRKVDPNEPFEYSFMDDNFQKGYDADNRVASLVSYATAIAIFISCLGLFGLAAFSAEQRTKEIGIRKVLGASEGQVVALLSGQFLKLVALAVLIGSPAGWYIMNRWLQDFAYRTTIGWTVFAMTAAAAMLIALFTIGTQAIRAAMANPVKSLRSE